MMGAIPFGALHITGGAATVALTTTAALMNIWSSAGGSNGPSSTYEQGDPAVRPDYANNRILVQAPGIFKVELVIQGDMDSAIDVTAQIYKNGTAYSFLKQKARCGTDKNQVVLIGFIKVVDTDALETIATFADPSASGFAGAGGAPKTMAKLEVYLTGSGSATITVEEAQFNVTRVG